MAGDLTFNAPSESFIKQIVENDLKTGKHSTIITRFPPEPNGFLHLGHAKSICLNFGLAKAYNGRCHLRFDDTNPTTEDTVYIESIQRDVKWLGGDWGDHLYYASDYFEQLYDWAVVLIKKGLAFVDHDTLEEIRKKRGSILQPGVESSYRNRSVEENLDLFQRMRNGEFDEGHCVLRAKIDMAHSNMNMRDPVLYRILKKHHPRTGHKWCIYPMYDYAHGQSDSIENITHSICTLEFELHRQLYDWFQDELEIKKTRQIEFARLNLSYTVMSKRKLLCLVTENFVNGWDDPRLPTISGMRRRGIPPEALHDFCERVGVAKRDCTILIELFERCVRECLHNKAYRCFAIIKPLQLTITNMNDDEIEYCEAANHPDDASFGTRRLAFTKHMYIDEEDFQENPLKGFNRLSVGVEVRLKYGYWVKCTGVEKDANGKITNVLCTVDKSTKNLQVTADNRKPKGTIHWLSKQDSHPAKFNIYSRLFNKSNPEEEDPNQENTTWRNHINKQSLVVEEGIVEKFAADTKMFPPQKSIQFERVGFFTRDGPGEYILNDNIPFTSDDSIPTFNMTIGLVEGFSNTKEKEEELKLQKEKDKEIREKAALERQRKKEEREARQKKKSEKRQEEEATS